MTTTVAPRRTGRWRAARWWAEGMVVPLPCGVLLLAALWGKPAPAVVSGAAVWVVAYALMRRHARDEFRRGWRLGLRAGVLGATEAAAGRTPAIVARGIATGDATPDPWDPPPA